MRPPRLAGFDYLGGYRYFVTCCTLRREAIFVERALVEAVRSQILRSAELYGFVVLAYVFMPDHIHLLVQGNREDSNFRLFMRNWRKRATLKIRTMGRPAIWQESYQERVLRGEDGTTSVIAYILNNPVRAGLVEDPMAYPYGWSVATHDPGASKPEAPHV